MTLKLYAAPAVEPVNLAEMKLHLRVDISDDDALISSLIAAARLDVETMCLHKLITQTWDLYMDGFPGGDMIELPYPPLQSVTGIYYTPDGSAEATLASTHYTVDAYRTPGRVTLKSTSQGGQGYWPGDGLIPYDGVRIRFVCGFGTSGASVDERLRQAVKLLAGHYYENREASSYRQQLEMIPQGVTALVNDFRAKARRF